MGNLFVNQSIISDKSFLEVCSINVAEIFGYWQSKCTAGRLPSRADVDPVEMVKFLPNITLVDVGNDIAQLRYRLVGTAEVEFRGYDPTGSLVKDRFLANNWEDVVANYRYVIEEKSFLYDSNDMPTKYGGVAADETLMMPLSKDGEAVNIVLLYAIQNEG